MFHKVVDPTNKFAGYLFFARTVKEYEKNGRMGYETVEFHLTQN
jgi:hypothetical protein